jgi:Fe2+ transport system protein FeoA
MKETYRLHEQPIGVCGKIISVEGDEAEDIRMIGFNEGTCVKVLRRALLGDPSHVCLTDSGVTFAVSSTVLEKITVDTSASCCAMCS